MSQPWQLQALFHYDIIPELHFASHFIARMLSRVRYFPATLGEDGKVTEITSGAPVEILNQIQDPGGGRSQLQYRYGLLQFVTGEGVLFGTKPSEEKSEEWRFLWKDEIKDLDGGLVERIKQDKTSYEPRQVGVGYRMWTPHPRHSDLADSPVRAVMEICEELLILTASVRATAVSRITNGMMVLPSELSPNMLDPLGAEDPENNIFMQDYMEHIANQIENPGSAEARVPFTLEGAYEYVDRARWFPTHDAQNDYLERELRKEAIHRMALGLDMPPEALLGMTDANHWTAKQVMHDMWRSHGVPKSEQFADDLSEAYLRPALEEEGYAGFNEVVIGQDDSMVVISPDRTEDADQAADRGQINDDAYLELKGYPNDYKATEDDKRIWLAVKLRNPALLKGTPYEMDPADIQPPGITGPLPSQNGNQDPSDGPPEPTSGRNGSRQESRTASARILGAADSALLRCRKLAGVRIRHKCKECAPNAPESLVASIMGVTSVTDPRALVKGGTEDFQEQLVEWGIDKTQAAALCQMVEVWAAKTLFESKQPELPSGFMAQVEKAKEVSGCPGRLSGVGPRVVRHR